MRALIVPLGYFVFFTDRHVQEKNCGTTIELNPRHFRMDHPACEVRAMDWNQVDAELQDQDWHLDEVGNGCVPPAPLILKKRYYENFLTASRFVPSHRSKQIIANPFSLRQRWNDREGG